MVENKESETQKETVIPSETEQPTRSFTLDETIIPPETPPAVAPAPKGKLKRFLHTKKGKVVMVFVGLLLVAGILFAIPTTRYGILGTFMKRSVKVVVTDAITNKPVTQADVTVGSVSAKTEHDGAAHLDNVPVGDYTLKITKQYYKASETSYQVPIFGQPQDAKLALDATGRRVSVAVMNKITKAVLAKATVTVSDTSAVTDDKGVASLVLPADKPMLKGTVKLDGYNQADVEIKVTEQADANVANLTPDGTIYYLSKQTGKINVMRSNLDGTDANVVVEGTGNEIDNSTVLLAARDWKYMALSAKRDAAKVGQLYLVDAKTNKLSLVDEGDATFQLVGWSDHHFIYSVTRNNKKDWEDKRQSLKSFNAETGKITTLDESSAMGTSYSDYQSDTLQSPYILEGKIVYSKVASIGGFAPTGKKSAIISIRADGSQKQTVKEFTMQRYMSIETKLYAPQEVFFRVTMDNSKAEYYEYEAGTVKSVTNSDDKFYNTFYPTYLVSPTGKKTFWYEPRNGKNALFVGDVNGKESTELATQSDYIAYGWYGDDYILLSKNESEMYIASATKPLTETNQPIKITNYHKPAVKFPGYGYGYGGQ